jgi:hypothetical protein
MSMGGPGGGRGGFRAVDEEAQRRRNASAPEVPDLGRRVAALFRPYRRRLAVTAVLVVAGAALAAGDALDGPYIGILAGLALLVRPTRLPGNLPVWPCLGR